MMNLKHILFAPFKASPTVPLLALSFVLAMGACGKDDPEPGPEPPTPPTPEVPEVPTARVPLSLHARPEGDDAPLWLDDDTLHVILTETAGSCALGDTAFHRYVNRPLKDLPYRFAPAEPKDTAFMPADSSRVDLLVYRPAFVALQRAKLHLSVDANELTRSGRPLMTAARAIGLHIAAPETTVTLSHRLAHLSVALNADTTNTTPAVKTTKAPTLKADNASASPLAGTRMYLQGNPAKATWSLPEEKYIAYGDTATQPFIMHPDGSTGYLYTIPNSAFATDPDNASELTLVVCIPGQSPMRIPLNDYLPEGLLGTGISVNIKLDVKVDPTPDPDDPDNPDPKPDPKPDPNPGPGPGPGPGPKPIDPNIIQVKVTLTDWINEIYNETLYPDDWKK